MMKDVTIFTFDEIQRIKHELEHMIENAKDGAFGKLDSKDVCRWVMTDLAAFKNNWFE